MSIPEPAESGNWIDQFNSNELSNLIVEALEKNYDVRASLATMDASIASAHAARGRRLPSLSADTSATYNAYGDALALSDGESFGLGLTATWEPDFWGRLSKQVSVADANLEASRADLQNLRLSVAGATARSWIDLTNAKALLELSRDELDVRSRSRELTERRFSAGVSSSLDVRLSRSAEASARASIADAELTVANAARALEVLLGRYPVAEIDAPSALPELGQLQDGGSPADLLARRPDIAAAEARLVASGLRADLARLAMHPRLDFRLTASIDDNEVENLLDPEYIAGRALASLTAPIFNGGALKADAEAALANARASAANYAKTVLSAWREVENARDADLSLAVQEAALTDALREAEAAEVLADRQYQQGLITIFDLINSQTRRISAQRQLIFTRSSRANNRISYHLALGGGALPVASDVYESTQP